jgi:CheY-like chemotaxis protein
VVKAAPSVLVVDDEGDFRASVSILLALEGFQVSEAADGLEALRLADTALPHDVILMDYRMPGLNGGQVTDALRARGVRSCIILLSAVADLRSIMARHDFDDAFAKPCDPVALIAAVRRCAGARSGC